jgi:hypothetical protein
MRIAFIVSIALGVTVYRCQKKDDSPVTSERHKPDTLTAKSVQPIDFNTSIEPILKARCTPCHFPGGKMYTKMPFDTASTILNHREGILRRIKDPAENEKLLRYLKQWADN